MNRDMTSRALFEPRTVAFVYASREIFKWGFNILHNIIRNGYTGSIYPVNPQGGSWYGYPEKRRHQQAQPRGA